VNPIEKVWDVNGGLGGPIKEDKLWFYTAHRSWGNAGKLAGIFANKDPRSLFYTPDTSTQGVGDFTNRADNAPPDLAGLHEKQVSLSFDLENTVIVTAGSTRCLGHGCDSHHP